MRGESSKRTSMLVLRSPETMVPQDHPIRVVKALADAVLKEISGKLDGMYAASGRASIPPEWLLKGSLLMALYSVRSERMLCEQLGYNMLFRWFLDMDITEMPFDHSTFSKNHERLMKHEVAQAFFSANPKTSKTCNWRTKASRSSLGKMFQMSPCRAVVFATATLME